MDEKDSLLVSIAARSDALMRPYRNPSDPCYGELCSRRINFDATGVPIRGGGSEESRKERQRMLEELAAAGMIVLLRPAGDRQTAGRLTPQGDAHARRLAGLGGVAETLHLMRDIARAGDSVGWIIAPGSDCGYVPETLLAGVEWGSKNTRAFGFIELDAIPGVARGWISFRPTARGHVWWGVTGAGRVAVAAGDTNAAPFDRAAIDDAAENLWLETYRAERAMLENLEGEPGYIGIIPMPVACSDAGHAARCRDYMAAMKAANQ